MKKSCGHASTQFSSMLPERLIRLTKSVGCNYALVAERQGLLLDAAELDRDFATVWKEMPMRPATGQPREDDDKGWWRDLVERAPRSRCPAGSIRSIATLFSRPPMGISPRRGSGICIRKCGRSSKSGAAFRAGDGFKFRWPAAADLRAPFDLANISGTSFFPANSARTSPTH